MIRTKKMRSAQDRSGATLVEFAVVFPVVLIFFFGAIELSWLNMVRNTVSNAAYEGARRGALPHAESDDAREVVMGILTPLKMGNSTEFNMVKSGDAVSVTVAVPLNKNNIWLSTYTRNTVIRKTVTLGVE